MTEHDLIRRAQQGDAEAVETLFRHEWHPIHRLVYRAVPHPADAQDLTQEVFLRALTGLDRYQVTGAPFRAYLVGVARNLLHERWRRKELRLVGLDQAGEVRGGSAALEEHVVDTDDHAYVHEVLASLPADYQTVIRLRLLEDRSTAEVATIMNRSPGAVRVLQHRALAALRKLLHEGSRP